MGGTSQERVIPMNESALWATIWLAAAATFGIGEILIAGSFFLLPFAVGALAASLVSIIGGHFIFGWVTFLVVSIASFFGLRPLARRLDENAPDQQGVGSNRLVGMTGVVLEPISGVPGDAGLVKVGTEEWRAEAGIGEPLAPGSKVRVVEVQGTRLLVEPLAMGIDYWDRTKQD